MALLPVLFFLAAIAVGTDQTPLRSGCDIQDRVVASLPAGTPVELRFRLSDGSDCFKVAATINGQDVSGYVPAEALRGLARYNQERSAAASVAVSALVSEADLSQPTGTANQYRMRSPDPAIHRAAELLNSSPAEALQQLQAVIERRPHDANAFLLAGLAAFRSDQLSTAMGYWKQSLDLAPNEALAAVYEDVKREAGADRSGEKLYGMHIALRYEGEALPVDTARAVLQMLDETYSRISSQLGCTSGERIVAIVQSRESYLRGTSAAEWSGGQYDGRIHIAWTGGSEVGPDERRALTHELVHACLSSIPSGSTPWPEWLQEGLAQKLSGDTLPAAVHEKLRKVARSNGMPKLESLDRDWSAMSRPVAVAAYNLALAAADALYDNYASYGIHNILNDPATLPRITADLDRKLGL